MCTFRNNSLLSIRMSEPFRSMSLKDRGNAAFKAKKFEDAIDLYKQAIDEEESSKDAKLLAILYSNIAQVCLELRL